MVQKGWDAPTGDVQSSKCCCQTAWAEYLRTKAFVSISVKISGLACLEASIMLFVHSEFHWGCSPEVIKNIFFCTILV